MNTLTVGLSKVIFSEMPSVGEQYWQGGARVGGKDFCFGCAEMSFVGGELILRLADCSKFSFKPEQILEIESCDCASPGVLPAAGIRIRHRVVDYPGEMVFLFFTENPKQFVIGLRKMGFGKISFWRGFLSWLGFTAKRG